MTRYLLSSILNKSQKSNCTVVVIDEHRVHDVLSWKNIIKNIQMVGYMGPSYELITMKT